MNTLLTFCLIFIAACGSDKKSTVKPVVKCGDNVKITTDPGDVDSYFDGDAGHYKLVKVDYYIEYAGENYIGGTTLFNLNDNLALSPKLSIDCKKMKDLPEGELNFNFQVAISFSRATGDFYGLYKEEITTYGHLLKSEQNIQDWTVINDNGSIFEGSGEGNSSFRKGKKKNQFIIEISDSSVEELGEFKFTSLATYELVN